MKKLLCVIPARWGSTRLPGKPLLDLNGKPVIQHVYERCLQASSLSRVVVATDDERIVKAVKSFGGEAVITSPDHPNGTCRVAEAARGTDCAAVLNVQGDEPTIEPRLIDLLAETIITSDASMATLAVPIRDGELEDPNVVKVVLDRRSCALYFSRSPIPYQRVKAGVLLHHLGLYAYKTDFLPVYAALEPTPLSEAESLEQLRALEHGYQIAVAVDTLAGPTIGIDVLEDLERARQLLNSR